MRTAIKRQYKLFSTSQVSFTYIYFHFSVESIVQKQVVGHTDSVRFHGVPLPIVIIPNVACKRKPLLLFYVLQCSIIRNYSTDALRDIYSLG